MRALGWVLLAGGLGLGSAGLFSSVLRVDRAGFVGLHAAVVAGFAILYCRIEAVSALTQLRRRWPAGLVLGLLLGTVLVRTVLAQPGGVRPDGTALAVALGWYGVVHGAADAVLLSIVPVLAVYGARSPDTLRRAGQRWLWGLAALAASLLVTALYHLGFAEFRGSALVQPLVGNLLITASYLFAGSPVAPLSAHVLMHAAAVWHGMDGTAQLPPHH